MIDIMRGEFKIDARNRKNRENDVKISYLCEHHRFIPDPSIM